MTRRRRVRERKRRNRMRRITVSEFLKYRIITKPGELYISAALFSAMHHIDPVMNVVGA